MSRTTIITVTFNSAHSVGGLLASLPSDGQIIFVDNASSDTTVDILKRRGHNPLVNRTNEGFGRACNRGAACASTEFLFFVNPDAVLHSGCVAALETAADTHAELVAANPRLLDPDGSVQFKGSSLLLPAADETHAPPNTTAPVPILTGAALFCRRTAFESVGGFDPAIFLYHEDHDLALRLKAAPDSLWWVQKAVATHAAGSGSPRNPAIARLKGYHMARSRCYVLKKHRRGSPFADVILRAFGGLMLPHNLLSARRRAKYLGQISGALSARADGGGYVTP